MTDIRSLERTLFDNLHWNKALIKFVARFLLALYAMRTVNLSILATAFTGPAKVELGPAAGLGHPPLGTDPAPLLDPVDRRVERALLDLKQFVRQQPNALDEAVAVERP
jgi:hypothetical protein